MEYQIVQNLINKKTKIMTVSELKKEWLTQLGNPNHLNLYFAAICEWDIDGPGYAGPPISQIVKINYKGSDVLALVYSLKNGGADRTASDAMYCISCAKIADNAEANVTSLSSTYTQTGSAFSQVSSKYDFLG